MWQYTQIRNSDEYIIYYNFDIFYTIARQIKGCHYYYISKEESRMYACNQEGFALHAVDIPVNIEIPISIYFYLLDIDESIVKQYKHFVLYKNLPWVMFPLETLNDHKKYNIEYTANGWNILDGLNNAYCIKLFIPEMEMFTVRKILDIYNSKINSDFYLGELQFFGNQEKNPVIQDVFTNKASLGRRYLKLTNMNGKSYGMMIFKNLFNMNKSDNLTIVIRDRKDIANTFQASFITNKKKSPIPNIIPFYSETTYAVFLNI